MAQWPGRIAARTSPPSPTRAEGASTRVTGRSGVGQQLEELAAPFRLEPLAPVRFAPARGGRQKTQGDSVPLHLEASL
jgi:hypothetical protein